MYQEGSESGTGNGGQGTKRGHFPSSLQQSSSMAGLKVGADAESIWELLVLLEQKVAQC